MVNYLVIILTIVCCCTSLVSARKVFPKIFSQKSTKHLIYNLMVTFLKICHLDTKKMIIYDNTRDVQILTATVEIQPQISVSLLSEGELWQHTRPYRTQDLKVDAVIIVSSSATTWDGMNDLFRQWYYNRDCIVYIFSKPLEGCEFYEEVLQLTARFYFSKAYFICLMKGQNIHVYTHDLHGDTKPAYWKKIKQDFLWGKNWTLYRRLHHKNANMSQLCPGFDFKRTDSSRQTFAVFGVRVHNNNIYQPKLINNLFREKIELYISDIHRKRIKLLKKILNMSFRYYMMKRTSMIHEFYHRDSDNVGIDGLLLSTVLAPNMYWKFFHPIVYEPVAIMSHHRGVMTPLEKIAQYYGKWTLSSLIIIIIIAFIIMWLSLKKVSVAAFNILRLLINAEIIISTNTWSLKLFFSMIFLYFLIIHATFSGHLAEFLTKVKYQTNIDTIEQLKDPSIQRIYYFDYKYDESEEFQSLQRKSKNIYRSSECRQILFQPKAACIAPSIILDSIRKDVINATTTFYISKKTFGLSLTGYIHRPGFPLREKFNRAFMVLFETGIFLQWNVERRLSYSRAVEKHIVQNHIKYRPIVMSDLDFAFYLLIIGNFAGSICFILEIGKKHYDNYQSTLVQTLL